MGTYTVTMKHLYTIIFLSLAQDKLSVKKPEKRSQSQSRSDGRSPDEQVTVSMQDLLPSDENNGPPVLDIQDIPCDCKVYIELVVGEDQLLRNDDGEYQLKWDNRYYNYDGFRIWCFTKNADKLQCIISGLAKYNVLPAKTSWKSAIKSLAMSSDGAGFKSEYGQNVGTNDCARFSSFTDMWVSPTSYITSLSHISTPGSYDKDTVKEVMGDAWNYYSQQSPFHLSKIYSMENQFGRCPYPSNTPEGNWKQWAVQNYYGEEDNFKFPVKALVWELPKELREPRIFFTTTFPQLDMVPAMLLSGLDTTLNQNTLDEGECAEENDVALVGENSLLTHSDLDSISLLQDSVDDIMGKLLCGSENRHMQCRRLDPMRPFSENTKPKWYEKDVSLSLAHQKDDTFATIIASYRRLVFAEKTLTPRLKRMKLLMLGDAVRLAISHVTKRCFGLVMSKNAPVASQKRTMYEWMSSNWVNDKGAGRSFVLGNGFKDYMCLYDVDPASIAVILFIMECELKFKVHTLHGEAFLVFIAGMTCYFSYKSIQHAIMMIGPAAVGKSFLLFLKYMRCIPDTFITQLYNSAKSMTGTALSQDCVGQDWEEMEAGSLGANKNGPGVNRSTLESVLRGLIQNGYITVTSLAMIQSDVPGMKPQRLMVSETVPKGTAITVILNDNASKISDPVLSRFMKVIVYGFVRNDMNMNETLSTKPEDVVRNNPVWVSESRAKQCRLALAAQMSLLGVHSNAYNTKNVNLWIFHILGKKVSEALESNGFKFNKRAYNRCAVWSMAYTTYTALHKYFDSPFSEHGRYIRYQGYPNEYCEGDFYALGRDMYASTERSVFSLSASMVECYDELLLSSCLGRFLETIWTSTMLNHGIFPATADITAEDHPTGFNTGAPQNVDTASGRKDFPMILTDENMPLTIAKWLDKLEAKGNDTAGVVNFNGRDIITYDWHNKMSIARESNSSEDCDLDEDDVDAAYEKSDLELRAKSFNSMRRKEVAADTLVGVTLDDVGGIDDNGNDDDVTVDDMDVGSSAVVSDDVDADDSSEVEPEHLRSYDEYYVFIQRDLSTLCAIFGDNSMKITEDGFELTFRSLFRNKIDAYPGSSVRIPCAIKKFNQKPPQILIALNLFIQNGFLRNLLLTKKLIPLYEKLVRDGKRDPRGDQYSTKKTLDTLRLEQGNRIRTCLHKSILLKAIAHKHHVPKRFAISKYLRDEEHQRPYQMEILRTRRDVEVIFEVDDPRVEFGSKLFGENSEIPNPYGHKIKVDMPLDAIFVHKVAKNPENRDAYRLHLEDYDGDYDRMVSEYEKLLDEWFVNKEQLEKDLKDEDKILWKTVPADPLLHALLHRKYVEVMFVNDAKRIRREKFMKSKRNWKDVVVGYFISVLMEPYPKKMYDKVLDELELYKTLSALCSKVKDVLLRMEHLSSKRIDELLRAFDNNNICYRRVLHMATEFICYERYVKRILKELPKRFMNDVRPRTLTKESLARCYYDLDSAYGLIPTARGDDEDSEKYAIYDESNVDKSKIIDMRDRSDMEKITGKRCEFIKGCVKPMVLKLIDMLKNASDKELTMSEFVRTVDRNHVNFIGAILDCAVHMDVNVSYVYKHEYLGYLRATVPSLSKKKQGKKRKASTMVNIHEFNDMGARQTESGKKRKRKKNKEYTPENLDGGSSGTLNGPNSVVQDGSDDGESLIRRRRPPLMRDSGSSASVFASVTRRQANDDDDDVYGSPRINSESSIGSQGTTSSSGSGINNGDGGNHSQNLEELFDMDGEPLNTGQTLDMFHMSIDD